MILSLTTVLLPFLLLTRAALIDASGLERNGAQLIREVNLRNVHVSPVRNPRTELRPAMVEASQDLRTSPLEDQHLSSSVRPNRINERGLGFYDDHHISRINFKIVGPQKNDAPLFVPLPEQFHQKASEMIYLSGNAYDTFEVPRYGYTLFSKDSGIVTDDVRMHDHITGDEFFIAGTSKEADWLGYKIFTKSTGSNHEIVVAFRGSQSRADFQTDMNAGLSPFRLDDREFGQIHGGFKEAYNHIRGGYLKDLEAAHNALGGENVKISLTGHSLGGSLATLSAVDLERNFNHVRR